jgi:hypothetical protein
MKRGLMWSRASGYGRKSSANSKDRYEVRCLPIVCAILQVTDIEVQAPERWSHMFD